MTNDVFQWILYRFEDIAVLARRTAFTAFGLPVSLFEVWASLFVLSVLFTVVFVSRSVSGGETENLASSEFDKDIISLSKSLGGSGVSERVPLHRRTISYGSSSNTTRSKNKRSGWSINFRL